jgi:hypothetical protein
VIYGGHQIMGNKNDTSGVRLVISSDVPKLEIGAGSLSFPTLQAEGEWMHIAAVRQAGEARLYMNGTLVESGTLAGDIGSTSSFMIGNAYDLGSPFVGTIDEVRVFDRALSDSEVKSLYSEAITVSSRPLGTSQS